MVVLYGLSLSHQWPQPDLSPFRSAYLGLHISGGFVGLPILILTLLLCDEIPRQPDLINFCISWVIFSISYTLLLLSGKTANPPHVLCFMQAAMLQAVTPMAATATFLLVFKIWRTFRDPYGHNAATSAQIITLSLPYIVFVVLLLASIAVQLRVPSSLNFNNKVYCTTTGTSLRRYTIPTFSIISAILIVGFEIAISISYYRSRQRIITSFPLAHRHTSLGLIVRLGIFNVYLFVTLGASITFLSGHAHPWAYLIQAALPLTAFVLFASQKRRSKAAVDPGCNLQALQHTRRPSEGTDYTPIHGRDVAMSPRSVAKSNVFK
ncbi:hypothetical protein HYPSUDRAFT_389166 [Hypholoma sublateritium FD-334 SS-4]|uniref:G-protein coupled receptors family 1 profile domain-containing protein n=1 Tax=Hypholoma sublateritium (strain FD-334 SS-4) TaxID=945553 RepID=A0A0D2Q2W5_HYPSF|nr:hypothetical protein HYPSUDRAFT_389166 [Hypholoma sublateritium FD-334 SS-4]